MIYDSIIVGGGVAGLMSAYFLQKEGMSVLVLERDEVCKGGSYAAGAFLTPKIGKFSPYKEYVNRSLEFSIDFYEQNFKEMLNRCGVYKLPYDEKDKERFKEYEKFMDIDYRKLKEGFFFPNAAVIDPKDICSVLKQILNVKREEVKDIKRMGDIFHISSFKTKRVVFATASTSLPYPVSYLRAKKICGYRYDVRFRNCESLKNIFHKRVSISPFMKNRVAIGATHIKSKFCMNLENDAKSDRYDLLKKAKEIMPLEDVEVLKIYKGERLSSLDYFPIVGELINEVETLKRYPYLRKGTKVPFDDFIYYKDLFIHTALGARGFVFAPYNAKLLKDLIVYDKKLPYSLMPVRHFIKSIRNPL